MGFDPVTERLFVPGNAALSVYDVSVPRHIKLLQQVETGEDARTGILFGSPTKYAVAVPATKGGIAHVLIFEAKR